MKMSEVWKPVPGYETLYEVSDLGRVKSLARTVYYKSKGRREVPERVLNPMVSKKRGNYPYVELWRDNRRKSRYVHALVLEAFVGPRPTPGHQVCHGDGNPGNNVLTNLRYGTRLDNAADTVKHGRTNRGEKAWNSKLDPEKVRALREEYALGGQSQAEIAEKYGLKSGASVSLIVNRKHWAWVE